jgi:hypothetical protein
VEYEGGVDVGLWGNRVSLELTGYSKTTQNALFDQTLGWDLNAATYEENIGQVRNSGLEGTVTATMIQGPRLTWDISLNASTNHNELVHLAPGIPAQTAFGVFRESPGSPLYGYWGVREHYADANHDGIIEANEVTVADSASYMGSSVPTRMASFATHVTAWRSFTVGALLDYHGGYRVYNTTAYIAAYNGTLREQNDPAAPLWMQARAAAQFAPGCCRAGRPSGYFEDGTLLRFRELSLTYALPQHWVHAMRLASLSLTGAVRNLALWTKYSGPDPEASTAGGGNPQYQFSSNSNVVTNNYRWDNSSVPLVRYWVVRLNAGL